MLGRLLLLRCLRHFLHSPKISPFACSLIVRHYTTKNCPIDFEQNPDKLADQPAQKAVNAYSTTEGGLSGMFIRFIQKESQILRDSMNIDDTLEGQPPVNTSNVSASMQKLLDNQTSDYDRFLLLLTFHPVNVPPALVMQYFQSIPAVLPQEKTGLLKILMFHNCWHDFWLVAVSEETSIPDVDELIDLVHECLESTNNLQLGLWQAMAAAFVVTSNLGLLHTISENVEYKLQLEKGTVESFHEFLISIQSASNLQLLHQIASARDVQSNLVLRAFYHRKMARLLPSEELKIPEFLHTIKSDKVLLGVPGYTSLLLHNEDNSQSLLVARVVDIIIQDRQAKLNDSDYLSVLHTVPNRLYPVYLSMCKNVKRRLVKTDQIISLLVDQSLPIDPDLAITITNKFPNSVGVETWTLLLPHVLSGSDHSKLLKRLRKVQPLKFEKVVLGYLKNAQEIDDTRLIRLAETCDNHPTLIRKIILNLEPSADNLSAFLRIDLSAYNLLEMMRFALRNGIVTPDTYKLFDRVLHKTWDLETLSRQASLSHSDRKDTSDLNHDDFRLYYRASSIKQRKALLYNLQALSQTISVTSPDVAASFLNGLKKHIDSNSFTFVSSSTGKSYIFDRLMARVMHFLYKSHSLEPKVGVRAIRNLLAKLEFDSTVTQAALFEYIVFDDPGICMDILKNYLKKKAFLTTPLMEGVHLGILKTQKLTASQRLAFFEQFRARMTELGYKSKMSAKTAAKFGDLNFEVAQKRGDANTLGWVIKMGYDRGVPVKVIKNWSIKLRL